MNILGLLGAISMSGLVGAQNTLVTDKTTDDNVISYSLNFDSYRDITTNFPSHVIFAISSAGAFVKTNFSTSDLNNASMGSYILAFDMSFTYTSLNTVVSSVGYDIYYNPARFNNNVLLNITTNYGDIYTANDEDSTVSFTYTGVTYNTDWQHVQTYLSTYKFLPSSLFVSGDFVKLPISFQQTSANIRLNFTYDTPVNFTFSFESLIANDDLAGAYNEGYDFGYQQGENIGYADGYDAGKVDGINEGAENGYTQGYNIGYTNGVNDSNNYTFAGLFGAVADTPILIVRNLFNFDFFGVNVLTVVLSLFTALILFYILRKLI